MKVRYRSNDELADLPEDAVRVLVDAGICDVVEDVSDNGIDEASSRESALRTQDPTVATTSITPAPRGRRTSR